MAEAETEESEQVVNVEINPPEETSEGNTNEAVAAAAAIEIASEAVANAAEAVATASDTVEDDDTWQEALTRFESLEDGHASILELLRAGSERMEAILSSLATLTVAMAEMQALIQRPPLEAMTAEAPAQAEPQAVMPPSASEEDRKEAEMPLARRVRRLLG